MCLGDQRTLFGADVLDNRVISVTTIVPYLVDTPAKPSFMNLYTHDEHNSSALWSRGFEPCVPIYIDKKDWYKPWAL